MGLGWREEWTEYLPPVQKATPIFWLSESHNVGMVAEGREVEVSCALVCRSGVAAWLLRLLCYCSVCGMSRVVCRASTSLSMKVIAWWDLFVVDRKMCPPLDFVDCVGPFHFRRRGLHTSNAGAKRKRAVGWKESELAHRSIMRSTRVDKEMNRCEHRSVVQSFIIKPEA